MDEADPGNIGGIGGGDTLINEIQKALADLNRTFDGDPRITVKVRNELLDKGPEWLAALVEYYDAAEDFTTGDMEGSNPYVEKFNRIQAARKRLGEP